MSISESSPNDIERALNAATRKYYSQVEAGITVDRQEFVKQYPGLEREIDAFLSNAGLLEACRHFDASCQISLFSEATHFLPREALPTTSNVRTAGNSVHNAIMVRDYRILERIGQGGMGCVYRALHVHLQKQVALKTIRVECGNSSEAIQRFTREMRILAKLEHPNIVQVFDAGEHQDTHYFVMELVPGIDLRKLIERIGPLPMPEASKIICLAAGALQYAHDQKILHRDVKPSNIMLTTNGSVKLLDLGLAQAIEMQFDEQISRVDQAVGTLSYMAPEQMANSHQCSIQSDVYSLGISLHELLSGSRPCHQTGSHPMVADVRSMRPDLDEGLYRLLDEMISNSPSARPQSMAEVAGRLKSFEKNADLSGLVSEYYHWNRRGTMTTPPPVRDDTVVNAAGKTDANDPSLDQIKIEHQPVRSGSKPRRGRTFASFLMGAATVACVAFFVPAKPQDEFPPAGPSSSETPALLSTSGQLEIRSDTDDPLVLGVIAEDNLTAERLDAGDESSKTYSVKVGMNDLPRGRYQLLIPGPVPYAPILFEISSSEITKVLPTPVLKTSFQFPVIPDVESSASYHGSLWLADWPTNTKTTYDLTLEVLSIDDGAVPPTKWLKVEVRSSLECGIYQEVGFLKIDSDEWDNARLSILEGWVEASGESIKQLVSERLSHADDEKLVLKFDPANDSLKQIASIALPVGRVSLHDILVLFFGDNHIDAADKTILQLRASLSENGNRNVWVEPILLDGLVNCYVASSHSLEEQNSPEDVDTDPRWLIARSSQNPFEIVKLEVATKSLVANCTTTVSRASRTRRPDLQRTLNELASRTVDPASFSAPHPFDLATIPDEPLSVTVSGEITRDRVTEAIKFTVSMLGTEKTGGRTLHWLELDVTTDPAGAGNREICRLLVDATDYPETLKIEQGWFAFDDGATVLPLSQGNQLESIINARLQLSAKPYFQRTGVVDLMWMLFHTEFTPSSKLTDLRRQINSRVTGRSVNAAKIPNKYRGELSCMLYEPSLGGLEQVTYKIHRCNQIPFGFARIKLDVPGSVYIQLEMETFQTLKQPYEKSPLGSAAHLATLELATAEKLLARSQTNWRVWSCKDAGKEYKVWAQFGGIVQSGKPVRKDVLLWDELGNERRIPYVLFTAADQIWIDKGRFWQTRNGPTQLPFNGRNLKGKVAIGSFLGEEKDLHPKDKDWLLKHEASIKKALPDGWEGFASYAR